MNGDAKSKPLLTKMLPKASHVCGRHTKLYWKIISGLNEVKVKLNEMYASNKKILKRSFSEKDNLANSQTLWWNGGDQSCFRI